MLIDGKKIANKIQLQTVNKIRSLNKRGIFPKLCVVLVGRDPASEIYVRQKQKAAEKANIKFSLHKYPATISTKQLISELRRIQKINKPDGLIIQLPLPEKFYRPEIFNAINPAIDVDCLTHNNLGRLIMNTQFVVPPTPAAILSILEELNIDIAGKNITIVGMGELVGKPIAIMLINRKASVTTCNSQTIGVKTKCLSADIIICGVGKPGILTGDMINNNTIVIDTGFSLIDGVVSGDVNLKSVEAIAAFVTPTPGGVGPITVAHLLRNTVICADRNNAKHKIT